MEKLREHWHSHRTHVVKSRQLLRRPPYSPGHTRYGHAIGPDKPLDTGYDLWSNPLTDFSWGYNGNGPAQLALAILTDYFGAKPGGSALAEALYEPFKFTVIAVLPDRWEMNFEEVGIALCRTLTEEPDAWTVSFRISKALVLDEFVGRQERNEPLNPADLSESIVAAIAECCAKLFP
jgi:hypothetical protein